MDNEMKNEKLEYAIWELSHLLSVQFEVGKYRDALENSIACDMVSPDDPWVAAALGCVRDEDIPDIALEFFLADVKAGLYDMKEGDK